MIQNNATNHSRINTVIVCVLTTNLKRANAKGNVLLNDGKAGLLKQSVVIVSQIYTIDKTQLQNHIGTLSAKRVEQILEGIRLLTEPREIDDKEEVQG